MAKKEKSGMRSATMPKDHFEIREPNLSVCKEKYASEFGNPKDLQKSADDLAAYARKNKTKY